MFFSGDPSSRKRVDLGGRSSKERDRQKLLEQARQERNRRQYLRQQNSAAIKIQVRRKKRMSYFYGYVLFPIYNLQYIYIYTWRTVYALDQYGQKKSCNGEIMVRSNCFPQRFHVLFELALLDELLVKLVT